MTKNRAKILSSTVKSKEIAKQTTSSARKGGIINFLIKILKFIGGIFNKFTPFIWILQTHNKIKGIILSFFTSFRIIKESFEYLNKLPVFQLMRKLIRYLSIISLIFNLVIFSIFTQFSPLLWISSIPGISQIGAFVYESSPEKTQNFIIWISLKIRTFLLWIWSGIIDFIKTIIKTVLGEIDNLPNKEPVTIPDKDKDIYKDIYNEKYLNKLKEDIYDWRFWILGGFIIIGIGAAAYFYWDSISSCWRRRDDSPPQEPFETLPFGREIHGPTQGNIPSPDSSSSGNSYDRFFRSSITDKISKFRNKVKGYIGFKSSSVNIADNIPRGVYQVDGRDMYNGLPLPRVETLENGVEYYFAKDTSNFSINSPGYIRCLSNSYDSSDSYTLINSFTGRTISRVPTTVSERISMINSARGNAIFKAPVDSYARNPIFEGTDYSNIEPSITTASISASTSEPIYPNLSEGGFEDVELTPRQKPIDIDKFYISFIFIFFV